ncbi:type II toxin-antitoxin system VapC family toxin [Mesorhizobium sp. VNQ89]|uniref:type II toxin-antitoxin system VapC family toxin n=1 Tax=Mesorhizobium quangtriensis TaxID=3157709 RepID=UPI0032B86229
MTGFLVDTSVLSALAPGRGDAGATDWFRKHDGALFLPVVALSEIRQGIARLERMGASRKAAGLAAWFDETLRDFEDMLLPVGVEVALIAGTLSDRAKGLGASPGYADTLIAATAQHHELTVATRNLRHFEQLGSVCLDPFNPGPAD